MLHAINRVLDPIRRQIRASIARGVISLVDDAGGLQVVQVQLMAMPQADGSMGAEVGDRLEVMRQFGFTSVPFPGAEVTVVSVGGVRAHGLVVATDDRRYRPKDLAAGESQMYDDQGQMIYLSRTGIVIKGAGLPLTITDTPSITLDSPQTTCTGALTVEKLITGEGGLSLRRGAGAAVDGNVSVSGGNVSADGIDLKTHVHTGVAGGSGTSGGPQG